MWNAPTPVFNAHLAAAPGGKAGIFHTIKQMRALVEANKIDPEIINFAVQLIYLEPQMNQCSEIEALFNFVRSRIRYVRDVAGIETLSSPQMTIRRRVGDCDDQATLLATLFESVGYPTRFVMAGYASDDFEHVYLQVLCNGQWLDCDPTMHEESIGYAPPEPRSIWFEKV